MRIDKSHRDARLAEAHRRRALEAAAIVYVGWKRHPQTDNKMPPEEHWRWRAERLPPTANQAAIETVERIIGAYEEAMNGSEVHTG